MVDYIIAGILILSAVVAPIWIILADKKTYITPKKEQNNGYSEDRS